MVKISVAMITCNGDTKIEKTLKAVYQWANEIVAVDTHSSDATVALLARYGAHIYDEDWKGEGLQYQSAVSKCTNEWVLILDQDEVVTEELKKSIEQELNNPVFNVYELRFKNICFGKFMKYGQSMYKRVLFKKEAASFTAVAWHSQMSTSEAVGRVVGYVEHYTYNDIEEYFAKFNRYTSDVAREMFVRGKKASWSKMFVSPVFTFVKEYIFRLNCCNGVEGLQLSFLGALYTMIKYSKLYGLHKKSEKGYDNRKTGKTA